MQIVNINLVPSGVNPIVYASQHDNGRVVRFHLLNGESEWNLDPSDTVRADITRPDGTEISIPMTNNATSYSDLTISYDDLDQEGVYVGEVVITDQYDNVTGSLNFILKAEPDPYGDDVTTETAVGNPCTFETEIADTLVSLTAEIVASGGYDADTQTSHPIVGHSELNLVRCGINLVGLIDGTYSINDVTVVVSNGKITANGTATSAGGRLTALSGTFYLPAGTYFINSFNVGSGITPYLNNADNNTAINAGDNRAFVLSATTRVFFGVNLTNGQTYNNVELTPMINIGSTATAYEPYNGTSYLVSFGQTVYGASHDVTRGKLRVTHGYITLDDTADWINVGGDYPQAFQIDTYISNLSSPIPSVQALENKSNLFPWATVDVTNFGIRWQVSTGSNGRLFVYDTTHSSDLTGFKNMLHNTPLQIAYKLATPIEIDVSAISVEAVSGVNNIVSDCGGDVEVTYIKKV